MMYSLQGGFFRVKSQNQNVITYSVQHGISGHMVIVLAGPDKSNHVQIVTVCLQFLMSLAVILNKVFSR
jgi:hypothetical protein